MLLSIGQKLLSEGWSTPLVVLDGTGEHSRGNKWEASSNVTIQEIDPAKPAMFVQVESIAPNPSLLNETNGMVQMDGLTSIRKGLIIPMSVMGYCTETILPF